MFSPQDAKYHAAAKKRIAPLYSMSRLIQMEDRVDEAIEIFVGKLNEVKGEIDMVMWFQCYVTDVIYDMTFDRRYGFMENGDKDGFFNVFHTGNKMSTSAGVYSEYWAACKPLFKHLPSPFDPIWNAVTRRVEEVEEKNQDGTSFIHGFIEAHHKHPDFTKKAMAMSSVVNIAAGSDTTSISLGVILYHLLKYPKTMQKLREEIDEANQSTPITYQQAQKLPYLQAVIHEAIRLFPATGLPMSRIVPEGGLTLAGQYFAAGTVVGVNTWVAHRNENVWGSDVNEFRPERWLGDKEHVTQLEANFLGFGGGHRSCIGKNISMLEMTKVIPELVTKFDFQLADPNLELKTEGCWFVKPMNFKVKIKPRK